MLALREDFINLTGGLQPMSDLGERIRQLMLELSVKWGRRVTLAEFGELVAEAEDRPASYTAQAVSNWIAGNEPGLKTILAMSRVAGWPKDPAWPPYRLAWGLELSPILLGGDISKVTDLPADSYRPIVRASARESRSGAPKGRKRP